MVILFVEEEGKLVPAGMAAYQNNLVTARELGSERGVNQKPVHAEHAPVLAMKDYGIAIPRAIMTVNKNFRPTPEKK
jgi:hypothetical protein